MNRDTQAVPVNKFKIWVIKMQKAATSLGSSFWFLPTLFIFFAIVTAQIFLPSFSITYTDTFLIDHFMVNSPQTSMQVVQVIASSLITVTSIAFSMTLVALVMASNSFGPRLIRSFMQSKQTQCVLGFLCASFVYCLLVLSQIQVDGQFPSHPILSVFIALILAVACVFVLIFFIHHVGVSIRADTVVEEISKTLLNDMSNLQTSHNDRAPSEMGASKLAKYAYHSVIRTKCFGYIQAVEYKNLVNFAREFDGILVMKVRAGKYVYPDTQVAYIYSRQMLPNKLSIDTSLVTGSQRTSLQDPQFAINQLVEMALRALSPSMDDPFTAMICIDKLVAAMSTFSSTSLPKTCVLDGQKVVRVVTNEESFNDLFAGAFTQIRQSSISQTAVLCHLLDVFYTLLESKNNEEHLIDPIKTQVVAIKECIERDSFMTNNFDKKAVVERMEKIFNRL